MHTVQLVPSLIITIWINMTQVSPRKVTSCQDILYHLKWDMQEKEIDQKQKRNLLSIVFNLFGIFEITEQEFLLDSRLSAWTFIYWKYLFEKGKTKIFLSRHKVSLTPYNNSTKTTRTYSVIWPCLRGCRWWWRRNCWKEELAINRTRKAKVLG